MSQKKGVCKTYANRIIAVGDKMMRKKYTNNLPHPVGVHPSSY